MYSKKNQCLSYFYRNGIVDLLQKLATKVAEVADVFFLIIPDVSEVSVAVAGFVVHNADWQALRITADPDEERAHLEYREQHRKGYSSEKQVFSLVEEHWGEYS